MSDKSNEQISNLMDGELEVNASKFLLKRMASDEALSKTWDNYHMLKSCLQKEASVPMIDVAKSVSQQLMHESNGSNIITNEIKKPKIHKWLKPVMGLGVAASVAFMSVTMLQKQQIKGGDINGIDTPIIASNNAPIDVSNPILQTNINATTAASNTTLIPPPSLSRFPSVSSQSNGFNQGQFYAGQGQAPYIIIINKSAETNQNNQLSPIRIQDVSD